MKYRLIYKSLQFWLLDQFQELLYYGFELNKLLKRYITEYKSF